MARQRARFRARYLALVGLGALMLSACDGPADPVSELEVAARSVQSAALSREGGWAAIGSGHHGGSLWRLGDGERLYNWNHKSDDYTLITSVSFSPEGSVAATADERTLVLWDRDSGEALQYWSSPAAIVDLALGPDGERALLGLGDYRAALYNLRRGGIIRNFEHSDRVGTVALSGDGTRALTGSDAGTATLWNAGNGEPIAHQQFESPVQTVALSPDADRLLASARYEPPRLWNAQGEVIWELPLGEEPLRRGAQITVARFSDDGSWLLTGQPAGRVDLWDLEEQRLVYSWRLPKRKAWSPNAVAVLDLAFTDDPDRFRAVSSAGFVHELGY